MIEEKREMIIHELNDIPENVLDNILALIEESKKPEKKIVNLLLAYCTYMYIHLLITSFWEKD